MEADHKFKKKNNILINQIYYPVKHLALEIGWAYGFKVALFNALVICLVIPGILIKI